MEREHSKFEVARAAIGLVCSLPWVIVTEAVYNLRPAPEKRLI